MCPSPYVNNTSVKTKTLKPEIHEIRVILLTMRVSLWLLVSPNCASTRWTKAGARGSQTLPETLALWSNSFFGEFVVLNVKLKNCIRWPLIKTWEVKKYGKNPPSQWLPNHSILLHSEPKIHQQIFIEHPLCANTTKNVQRKYGLYHRSLYFLVVQTGHVQMTRQKPHRWYVTLTKYWCDSRHAVCWMEAF